MKPAMGRQDGVMLIEALVGILIFAVGIIALMGLQAAAISSTTDAKYRSDAAFLANQIITEMWVDQANVGTSYNYSGGTATGKLGRWVDQVRDQLPNGTAQIRVTAADGGFNIQVVVLWQKPSDATQRNFTSVSRISYNTP